MYEYITYDKVFYNMKSPSAITAETLKSIQDNFHVIYREVTFTLPGNGFATTLDQYTV